MASQFSTMSTEMIEKEIYKVEERIKRGGSQQDKLMLFALKTEFEQRAAESSTTDETKFRKFLDAYYELEKEFEKIDFEKIRTDNFMPDIMKFYHDQMEFAHKVGKMIDDRSKTE